MALDNIFLQYPQRHHGMDHERYNWRNLFDKKLPLVNDENKLGVMLTVPIEFFPLNPTGKPFKAPGSMVTYYPDYRHFTTREYGNRVGVFRLLKSLSSFNVKANIAINSDIAEKYPFLINEICNEGHEIICHGVNMDNLHFTGLNIDVENEQIKKAKGILENISKQEILGWISPAYSQSFNTPDLLVKNGFKYMGDWSNDEMPYFFKTINGEILNIPISQEISDRQIIINNHHTEDSFREQVIDQFDYLKTETKQFGSRIFSLTITPYITGLPYRIKSFDEILAHITSHKSISNITGKDLV